MKVFMILFFVELPVPYPSSTSCGFPRPHKEMRADTKTDFSQPPTRICNYYALKVLSTVLTGYTYVSPLYQFLALTHPLPYELDISKYSILN